MKFKDFEKVMSAARMHRYLQACNGDTMKALTLYRLNLRLSQELFTVISCFEIAIRNAINSHYQNQLGADWLKAAASTGGLFNNHQCRLTCGNINDAITKLGGNYTHDKFVAELGFGFWRYLFAQDQFRATGQTPLTIFPAKPISTATTQYNQTYVFNQLAAINNLRNRIAHHEPVGFKQGLGLKYTAYVQQQYVTIKQLFQWMTIDESALLYGLDHVLDLCRKIDQL